MSELWSRDEFAAAVDAYLSMLGAFGRSIPVNKASIRKTLISGPLRERSNKSVDFRFCNISYVLQSEGKSILPGYAPLKNIGERGYAIVAELLEERGVLQTQDYAPTHDDDELVARTARLIKRGTRVSLPQGTTDVRVTMATHRVYARDPRVRAFVLQRASGVCESCEFPAPFETESGLPYLEVHHIVPLADGGSDTVENAAALCPNCHRRAHHGADRAAFAEHLRARSVR